MHFLRNLKPSQGTGGHKNQYPLKLIDLCESAKNTITFSDFWHKNEILPYPAAAACIYDEVYGFEPRRDKIRIRY